LKALYRYSPVEPEETINALVCILTNHVVCSFVKQQYVICTGRRKTMFDSRLRRCCNNEQLRRKQNMFDSRLRRCCNNEQLRRKQNMFDSRLEKYCNCKKLRRFLNTVISWYTSNRFTSFRVYEMYKLIPVFQFTSQFSLIRASSSRKRSLSPSGSNGKLI
jgi:hypothetical protein